MQMEVTCYSVVASVDSAVRENISSILQAKGWVTLLADTVSRGVELALEKNANLVIVDIDSGDVSVDEVAETFSTLPQTSVVFLTGEPSRPELADRYVIVKENSHAGVAGQALLSAITMSVCNARKAAALETVSRDMAEQCESCRARLQFYEAMTMLAKSIASRSATLSENMRHVLDTVLMQVRAERGSIMLKEGDSLVVRAATNPEIMGMRQPLDSRSASAFAALENIPLIVEGAKSMPDLIGHDGRDYKSENFISIPISFQGEAIGVINVTDKDDLSRFDKEDEGMISTLSGVIVNALLAAEVQEERDRVKTAHGELQDLQILKDNLMHMIVHDLKGPAGMIISNLSMLDEYVTDDFAREVLNSALSSGEELSAMILNILDVSKIEEGKFRLNVEPKDIVELTRAMTKKIETQISREDKKITFTTESDTTIARVDQEIYSRVVWNLISNANNHTTDGGVIDVSIHATADEAVVSIRDNGVGIAAEELENIFEKFFQAGKKRHKYSTGLGLTFCKMAVDAHNGSIRVESEVGNGSTFTVSFPLETAR